MTEHDVLVGFRVLLSSRPTNWATSEVLSVMKPDDPSCCVQRCDSRRHPARIATGHRDPDPKHVHITLEGLTLTKPPLSFYNQPSAKSSYRGTLQPACRNAVCTGARSRNTGRQRPGTG